MKHSSGQACLSSSSTNSNTVKFIISKVEKDQCISAMTLLGDQNSKTQRKTIISFGIVFKSIPCCIKKTRHICIV